MADEVFDLDEVALAKRPIHAERERAKYFLHGLLRSERDGQAAASEAKPPCATDTGSGIDPTHLDKIWERLSRAARSRSRRGLGLGLSFVKAIVEAHGGTVSAMSTPRQGSTYSIVLPSRETGTPR